MPVNGTGSVNMVSHPGYSKTIKSDISLPACSVSVSIGLYHLADGHCRLDSVISQGQKKFSERALYIRGNVHLPEYRQYMVGIE